MLTVISLLDTCSLLQKMGIDHEVHLLGSSVVTTARNKVADQFLQSNKNRLFWIDSDMQWEAKDFVRILAMSSIMECVGVAYVAKDLPLQFQLNYDKDKFVTNDYGCI